MGMKKVEHKTAVEKAAKAAHHALCAALDTIIKEKPCPPSNT